MSDADRRLNPDSEDCWYCGGAGTTALVAKHLKRNAVLIELNPEYAAMAERRIDDAQPQELFDLTETVDA